MLTDSISFYLVMLLLCHITGDYYLQTNKMAASKENSIRNTLLHSVFYAVPFILFLFGLMFFGSPSAAAVSAGIILFAIISHAVIDLAKCLFEQKRSQEELKNRGFEKELKMEPESEFEVKPEIEPEIELKRGPELEFNKELNREFKRNVYLTDQILHLSIIAAAAFFLSEFSESAVFSSEIYMFFKCVLFAVVIAKPVNISFKKIFEKYQPAQKTNENENETEAESIIGAGATIGILERFLMGILIGIGQYAALGLVIAAKSIARYDQISKNKMFAEYFLIGTLYSVLATLVVYFIIFVFFA